MRTIRPSVICDIGIVMELSDEAREIMRANGNALQWVDGYPQREVFLADIEHGHNYLIEDDGKAVGAFSFILGPDPTYAKIEQGAWIDTERPYGVIHRICSRPEAHGVFSSVVAYCSGQINNIRIDTHRDNLIMQHLLGQHGFQYCGIIYLLNGDERLAFQRIMD